MIRDLGRNVECGAIQVGVKAILVGQPMGKGGTGIKKGARSTPRYYGRSFTTCGRFISSRPGGLASGGGPFAEASDPGGSRNGSTEMRS